MNKRQKIIRYTFFVTLGIIVIGWLYGYSPRKFEFLGYYHKIGAHRVNSIDKLKSSQRYFDAIELDLVYDASKEVLDVVHPPAPSTGLYFSSYLKAVDGTATFLWLDIKNLSETNAEAILWQLNKSVEARKYPKEKILIETREPAALPIFSAEGYKTSYYLPQQLRKLDEARLKQTTLKINKTLQQQPKLAISTSFDDYALLKLYFPDRPKYLWSLTHKKIGDYGYVREFLKDDTVQLVLVRYKPLW